MDRFGGQSTFLRLETPQLNEWLADYTLGELWQKNLLGGRPRLDSQKKPPAPRGDLSVTRIKIIVEGQTEESFIDKVLAPALWHREIYLTPIILQRPWT